MAYKFKFKETALKVGGVMTGVTGASILDEKFLSATPKGGSGPRLSENVAGLVLLAIGVAITEFAPGKFGEGTGNGVIAVGSAKILKANKIVDKIAGDENFDGVGNSGEYYNTSLSGSDEENMSGDDNFDGVAGEKEMLSGDNNEQLSDDPESVGDEYMEGDEEY